MTSEAAHERTTAAAAGNELGTPAQQQPLPPNGSPMKPSGDAMPANGGAIPANGSALPANGSAMPSKHDGLAGDGDPMLRKIVEALEAIRAEEFDYEILRAAS